MNRTHKILLHAAPPALPPERADTSTMLSGANAVPPTPFGNAPPRQTVTIPRHLIVVIDDSPTVRKILETCLQREDFAVQTFPDGVEAMRWLVGAEKPNPHLVILDIRLPKIDGYEVAQRLKAKSHLRSLPIVMLSRSDSIIDKLKGRLAGANVYLTKPFKTEDIVSVVKTQLGIALPPLEDRETARVSPTHL